MRQMAGCVDYVHRQTGGERFGMGDRDDAVISPPDQLNRHRQRREAAEVLGLLVDDPALVSRAMV